MAELVAHNLAPIMFAALVVFLLLVFVGKKLIERAERRHLAEDEQNLEHADGDVKD